jgi:hypothetical protein
MAHVALQITKEKLGRVLRGLSVVGVLVLLAVVSALGFGGGIRRLVTTSLESHP